MFEANRTADIKCSELTVREQEDPNTMQEEATAYLPRVIESPSVEVHSSSRAPTSNHGRTSEYDPPPSLAKISKSHKNPPTSSSHTPKGKNSQSTDEDNRTNIRASTMPRPRAVLSSPDNDDIIGNQNRLIKERETLLKRQSPGQNIQAQGKLSQKNARVASPPLSTRKVPKKESGGNSGAEEKRKLGSQVDALKQRPTVRRG